MGQSQTSDLTTRTRDAASGRWLIPAASALALIVGNGSISVFAFGIFIRPLQAEFGWSRASISGALALCGIFAALTLPIVGLMMDRFGIRRVLLVSVLLYAANVAALGAIGGLLSFTLLTALSGVTGAAQSPVGYVKAVAGHFCANRGLAIGVAMSGVGLGTSLIPLYAQWLTDRFGWRTAYMGLGIAVVLLACPVATFLIRESPADALLKTGMPRARFRSSPGATLRTAMKMRAFWLLAATVLLVSMAVNGSLVHLVPMLIDRHWRPTEAASMMIVAGMASMIGRLLAGALIDRFFAPFVAVVFFMLAAGGLILLATGSYVILASLTAGLAAGAEVDLIGFLTSRYFGLRYFGGIYGALFAIFTLGAGLGPYLIGTVQSLGKDYGYGLFGAALLLLGASACVLALGPYADDDKR